MFLYSFVRSLSRNFAKFSYISFREISRKSFENFAKCEIKISRSISRNFVSRNFAGHPSYDIPKPVSSAEVLGNELSENKSTLTDFCMLMLSGQLGSSYNASHLNYLKTNIMSAFILIKEKWDWKDLSHEIEPGYKCYGYILFRIARAE